MSQLIIYCGLNTPSYTAVELYVMHIQAHTSTNAYNIIYNMLYIQYQGHLDLVLANEKQLIVVYIYHVLANERKTVCYELRSVCSVDTYPTIYMMCICRAATVTAFIV